MFRTIIIKLFNRLFPVGVDRVETQIEDQWSAKTMTANIVPTTDGRYALYVPKTGEQAGVYTRARDARRGAARKGLVLA